MARSGITLSSVKRWMWRLASAAVAASLISVSVAPTALGDDLVVNRLAEERCTAYAPTPTSELGTAWHLQRLDTDALWALATGKDVKIAVIDTGTSTLGSAYLSSTDQRIRTYNLIPDPKDPQGGTPQYDCDHGTAVTSIIAAGRSDNGEPLASATNFAGVAPDASVLAYRTLINSTAKEGGDQEQEENLAYTIAAIRHAIAQDVDIINLSQVTFEDPLRDAFGEAIADAIEAGIVVVAAAGNQGQGAPGAAAYPASFPGVISVGMSNQQDSGDLMTHVSPRITVGAPGRNLVALRPSKHVSQITVDNQAYVTDASGTSYAAPVVTGVVALMIEFNRNQGNPDLTPEEVAQRLIRTADLGGVRAPHPQLGNGIINPMRALTETMGASPTPMPLTSEAPPKLPADPDDSLPLAAMVGLGVAIGSVVLVLLGIVAAVAIPAARRRGRNN